VQADSKQANANAMQRLLIAHSPIEFAILMHFTYVGLSGGSSGMLLWPAVVLHAVLTVLLARPSTGDRETKK